MNFKLGKTLQIKLACSLSVYHQEQISISRENPKLSMIRNQTISIPPRPVYHPAIVNACETIFGRHPDDLTPGNTTDSIPSEDSKVKLANH